MDVKMTLDGHVYVRKEKKIIVLRCENVEEDVKITFNERQKDVGWTCIRKEKKTYTSFSFVNNLPTTDGHFGNTVAYLSFENIKIYGL